MPVSAPRLRPWTPAREPKRVVLLGLAAAATTVPAARADKVVRVKLARAANGQAASQCGARPCGGSCMTLSGSEPIV
jgi:hypothetical protein